MLIMLTLSKVPGHPRLKSRKEFDSSATIVISKSYVVTSGASAALPKPIEVSPILNFEIIFLMWL